MLGQVDPVTLDLIKPSLYSEVVWESRKNKMTETRRSIDWLVCATASPPPRPATGSGWTSASRP